MFHIFTLVDGNLVLDKTETLIYPEFLKVWEDPRNITKKDPKGVEKLWAYQVFKYLYLSEDFRCDYYNLAEVEREKYALQDSGIVYEEVQDPVIKLAKTKYRWILEYCNVALRLLNASYINVNELIDRLKEPNYSATDENGKYVNSAKEGMATLKELGNVHSGMKDLEMQVKKEMEKPSRLIGNAEPGRRD